MTGTTYLSGQKLFPNGCWNCKNRNEYKCNVANLMQHKKDLNKDMAHKTKYKYGEVVIGSCCRHWDNGIDLRKGFMFR